MAPATVVLFGSRAAGRHSGSSDIDLLVIVQGENTTGPEVTARTTASAYMKANLPTLNTGVIVMTEATFKRSRLANQHVAGQAARCGVVMSGERLDHDDEYPPHWTETKQRLENTQECQFHFNHMVDGNSGNQKLMGFVGQQAIENALKGWLSTHNDPRTFGHELHPLWEDIRKLEDWSTQEMRELEQIMDNLFEYTRFQDPNDPGESLDWLTRYAIVYRYGRPSHIMSREQRKELQALLNDALNGIMDRIHQLSGTSKDDLMDPWPKTLGIGPPTKEATAPRPNRREAQLRPKVNPADLLNDLKNSLGAIKADVAPLAPDGHALNPALGPRVLYLQVQPFAVGARSGGFERLDFSRGECLLFPCRYMPFRYTNFRRNKPA